MVLVGSSMVSIQRMAGDVFHNGGIPVLVAAALKRAHLFIFRTNYQPVRVATTRLAVLGGFTFFLLYSESAAFRGQHLAARQLLHICYVLLVAPALA